MKKTTDFDPYVNTLPYASEILGVYQPLLGWRSKRMRGRIEAGYRLDRKRLIASLNERFRGRPNFPVTGEKPTQAQIRSLISSTPRDRNVRPIAGHVLESVRVELPPADKYDEAVWGKALYRDPDGNELGFGGAPLATGS